MKIVIIELRQDIWINVFCFFVFIVMMQTYSYKYLQNLSHTMSETDWKETNTVTYWCQNCNVALAKQHKLRIEGEVATS